MKGRCKFFNETKGWGFLAGADGENYFVHKNSIKGTLTKGMEVEFQVEPSDKGLRAIEVHPVMDDLKFKV